MILQDILEKEYHISDLIAKKSTRLSEFFIISPLQIPLQPVASPPQNPTAPPAAEY